MKDTITEMKNALERITSRLDEAEDCISDLEDKVAKNTQMEQQKEKRIPKNYNRLRDHWDNIKHNNVHVIGVPEEEERKQVLRTYVFEEIITENFHNLAMEVDKQV